MAIITISQGDFTGGRMLAEGVSSILGYQFADRQLLIETSKGFGISPEALSKIFDSNSRWRHCWRKNRRFFRIVSQAAFYEIVRKGNVVYFGRVGPEFVSPVRHTLKVFLTAPIEYRAERLKFEESDLEQITRRFIIDRDKASNTLYQSVFGTGWQDLSRYDLALNLSKTTSEAAMHLIAACLHRAEYQPTVDSNQILQDLRVASRAELALFICERTRNLNVSIQVRSGKARVSGFLIGPDFDLRETVIDIIKTVPGVEAITRELEMLPRDDLWP